MRFDAAAEFGLPFKRTNPGFTIIGSCNGLLCLSDDRTYHTHAVILWNPCVERSVLLPRPNLNYNLHGRLIMRSLGFGYDCVTDDYKVVSIKYANYNKIPPQVELYKLSTGVWHDISDLGLQRVIDSKRRHAYVHGANHWIANCANNYDLIVLFDMCGEVFREMRLPEIHARYDQRVEKDLVVCMGSLALVTRTVYEDFASDFSVWVMNECGVDKSWTKHFSIDCIRFYAIFNMPLWVRKCGQYIALFDDAREISYHNCDGDARDHLVSGARFKDYQSSGHAESYKESLVLLERGPDSCDAVTCSRLQTFLEVTQTKLVDMLLITISENTITSIPE